MSDVFSFHDGRLGPDGDSVPRSGWAETPEWYQRMVTEFEDERQAHLNTKAILTDLLAELRGQADIWQEGDINEDRWDYPAMMLRAHADRAEARLRELNKE